MLRLTAVTKRFGARTVLNAVSLELAAGDGKTLFEICSLLTSRHGLGLTRQAISQHLAVLESAGLVTSERRGRTKLHYFNPEPLTEITRRWPTPEGPES